MASCGMGVEKNNGPIDSRPHQDDRIDVKVSASSTTPKALLTVAQGKQYASFTSICATLGSRLIIHRTLKGCNKLWFASDHGAPASSAL